MTWQVLSEVIMKKKNIGHLMLSSWFCLVLSVVSCSMNNTAVSDDVCHNERSSTTSLFSGIVIGGFVENAEMTGIDGLSEVDIITGATKKMYNAGIHSEVNINGHKVETGLDYLGFEQSVVYEMPSYFVYGKREIRFHQIRLPLTYNLHFFKNSQNDPKLILKAGLSAGYTFSKSITDSNVLPDYSFKNFDYGLIVGISTYPIQYKQNYRIGLYLDLYRGSRIYEDIYHEAEGMGGNCFMKFGVTMQPLGLKF